MKANKKIKYKQPNKKAEKAQISSPQGPYPQIPRIPIKIYKIVQTIPNK